MLPNVYSRITSLNDVVGRVDYIGNPRRQEHIVLHDKAMKFSWRDYVQFEHNHQKSAIANNQAREIVISLPNQLAAVPEDDLKKISHDIAVTLLGENRDYEFAVHWNKRKTNLHMHLIFSEREIMPDLQPKRYKRDFWADKKTNKMTKANAEGAELRHKKGDVMKDEHGNIRYESDVFSPKDKLFTQRSWYLEMDRRIQAVLGTFGYQVGVYNPVTQIAQKKLYKGASKEYTHWAKTWNTNVRKYNQDYNRQVTPLQTDYDSLKQAIEINPRSSETRNASELISQRYDLPFILVSSPESLLKRLKIVLDSFLLRFNQRRQSLFSQIGSIDRLKATLSKLHEKDAADQPMSQLARMKSKGTRTNQPLSPDWSKNKNEPERQ